MKKTFVLILATCLYLFSFSQTYKLTWGQEIKVKKGTTDMDIVAVDNSGLYFSEASVRTTFGGNKRSNKLFKFDKNFSPLFEKDYKRDLEGMWLNSIQPLDNDLFLFSHDYESKKKLFKVFGAKIDKNTGDLVKAPAELAGYEKENSKDDYETKITAIENGKSFFIVSNISSDEKVSIGIIIVDNALNKKENIVITLTSNPKAFRIHDVKFTKNKKIVLLGKEYNERQEGEGKKAKTYYVFRQLKAMIFNTSGIKEKEIILDAGDKFMINGQLIEQRDGQLLLAGFYSNVKGKEGAGGFFINRVDPERGELIASSYKEISPAAVGRSEAQQDFLNDFIIRSVDINPLDNSIIISSEIARNSTSTRWETSKMNGSTRSIPVTEYSFTNLDILVIDADKDGQIKWINVIPKSQIEVIRTSSIAMDLGYTSYFASGGGMPYYSSYSSLLRDNKFIIVMNDHAGNSATLKYGDKVNTIGANFKGSNVYAISIDLATGKMNRRVITSNSNEEILTPRHAYVTRDEFLIASWNEHYIGKSELKFARVSIR